MKKIPNKLSRRDFANSLGFAVAGLPLLSACGGKKAPQKGVLRVALSGGPDSLDPMKAEYAASALLFRQYLLPIVGYGANGIAAPAIASSWTSADGFKEWVFTITPNLKWSDGKDLGAVDVVKSLQKLGDNKVQYPDAPELFSIKGFKDIFLKGGDTGAIGVSLIDTDKVKIQLEGADAKFPERLQEVYPVPLHAVEANGDQWTAVGKIVVSGPYIPTTRTQTRLSFTKNPLGGWAPPMAERIDVETVDDSATRVRMFQSGDVDLAQDPPMLRYGDLAKELGTEFQRQKAPRFFYISLNTKRAQFMNKDIRRALSMGFDRKTLATNIMRDAVEPATRFIRTQEQMKYDPDAARAIMTTNGYSAANPLRFEIMVSKDERERAALQIINMWKEIFVEATVGTADSSAISARLNGFDFDAAIVRVDKGMKSDPLDLMGSFSGGGNAYSHQWKNPAFDKALDDALAVAAEPARTAALIAAERYLLDEAPILPLWFADGTWLVSKRITGGIAGMSPIIWGSLGLVD